MKHLIGATIALTLLASTAAMAQRDTPNSQGQNYQGQNYQGQNYQGQNYQGQNGQGQNGQGQNGQGRNDARQNNGDRFDPQGFNDRGSDRPHWSRGDRLPQQYRQDQYVVRDWQQHNLRTPPRGYRWVRNDNDQYLLAAITNGIIAEIVSQNQYRNDYRWSRGDRLSGGYLENRYVVSDWRGNHLRRPDRGHHWVHINNQYMMTAIGSGVIAEIVVR